ncbi:hypothetical protein P4129_00025 [Pseudomonas aeruginosa]|nr:hypothetical protein [Pseudomonas aeruginosa]
MEHERYERNEGQVADAPGKRALLEAALRLEQQQPQPGGIGCASWREAGLEIRTPSIGISAISTILPDHDPP